MSGFIGVVNLDGAPIDDATVARMLRRITARGPDAQRLQKFSCAALGHALFSTVQDTAPDVQPCSLDGELWIVADARVDDRETLKAALALSGEHPTAQCTDAQLILHAYRAWGARCAERLIGDYAFAIWDGRLRRLFCARDPFGVKLFYFAVVGNAFVFSNTLDAVRLHPAVSNRVNERAIGDFLLVGHNADLTTTTYRDIQRIAPAHSLIVELPGGELTFARHWDFPVPEPIRYRRAAEVVEHFRMLLQQAVRDRLRIDRASIYLSGGLDSTTLAATVCAVHQADGQPSGFVGLTAAYDVSTDEDGYFARMAATALGLPHEIFVPGQLEYFRPGRRVFPEPFVDFNGGRLDGLEERVAQHGRVSFIGEDGDALLKPSSLRECLRQQSLLGVAGSGLRYLLSHQRLPYIGSRLRDRRRGRTWSHATLSRWLAPEFVKRAALRERAEELDALRNSARHPTRSLSCRYLKSAVWQQYLESLDMSVSNTETEVRLPLIDTRIIEFVFALPSIPWCERKELLVRTMRGTFPEELLRRPKRAAPENHLDPSGASRRAAISGMRSRSPALSAFVDVSIWQESVLDPKETDLRPRALAEWLVTL